MDKLPKEYLVGQLFSTRNSVWTAIGELRELSKAMDHSKVSAQGGLKIDEELKDHLSKQTQIAARAVRRMSTIIDHIEVSDDGEVTSDIIEKDRIKRLEDPDSPEYFITHSLIRVADLSTKYTVVPQMLYDYYLDYCRLHSLWPVNKAVMDRDLKRLGYKKGSRKFPRGSKNVIIQVALNVEWLKEQRLI